jgi:hypothetical protein
MSVSCRGNLTCYELLLSLSVFIHPKPPSQTDPLPWPTPEDLQFKLIVAIRRQHAIFLGLSSQRPPVQSRGTAFAQGIQLVALPAIQNVSALRRSISPQDSTHVQGRPRRPSWTLCKHIGGLQGLDRRSCRPFIGD